MASRPVRTSRALDDDGQGGFSVIEVMVALGIFAIVAIGFASTMATSLGAQLHSRLRTTADQLATQQVEQARSLPYDDVGTVGGNPRGLIQPMATVTVGTTAYQVQTTVQLVDDPVPGAFRTYADYKRLIVEVTRAGSPTSLARIRTQIAPPTQPSLTKGVIQAQVVEGTTGAVVPNVPVTLTGPGFSSSVTTDGTGTATFAALAPTTGSGTYQLSADPATVPTGWRLYPAEQLAADTTSPLLATQKKTLTLRVVKQAAVHVTLTTSTGTSFANAGRVTVTSSRGGMTSYAVSGGAVDVPLWRGATYQVAADADPGTAGTWWSSPSTPVTVSTTGAASTVPLTMTRWPTTTLTVDVGKPDIAIRVKGGAKSILVSGTSAADGKAVFQVPTGTPSTPYSVEVDAQSGWAAKSAPAAVLSAPLTVSLTLVVGP